MIFSSPDLGLLNLLKSQLETRGILGFIKNEFPPAAGEVPPILAEPELWIFEEKYSDEATGILHDLLKKSSHSAEIWKCQNCGELLEGQFELCWKCGNSREDSNG